MKKHLATLDGNKKLKTRCPIITNTFPGKRSGPRRQIPTTFFHWNFLTFQIRLPLTFHFNKVVLKASSWFFLLGKCRRGFSAKFLIKLIHLRLRLISGKTSPNTDLLKFLNISQESCENLHWKRHTHMSWVFLIYARTATSGQTLNLKFKRKTFFSVFIFQIISPFQPMFEVNRNLKMKTFLTLCAVSIGNYITWQILSLKNTCKLSFYNYM
jgi:hypothetical protein